MTTKKLKQAKSIKHDLDWFMKRIGKIVYRKDAKDYGLMIKNQNHAKYLEMVQADLDLYYSDKPFNL